ncbi:MAG: N-acetylmuramoyl-L-alanine amidase CwlD [Lachnospiraceae bacterium]
MLLLLCSVLLFAKSKAGERLAAVFLEKEEKETVVVIDAGHGGMDPGKVGTAGTLEKEINLAVALRLKALLEESGVRVVMTRTEDGGLYAEDSQNKKKEDMRERVRVITEAKPDLAISIHQNSYPSEACKGAQVFYYQSSEESKRLAEVLQKAFPEVLRDGNTRQAKANADYYLLRKTPCTIVIAECGFLSNPSEEALLVTEAYQNKIAEALHLGILRYLSKSPETGNETQ